jgi:hypothetical protein
VFDTREALHRFDGDAVLLSGRPSRLPAVSQLLIDKLAIAPDRIVRMHSTSRAAGMPDYAHGTASRSQDHRSGRRMLCALPERDLLNFALSTRKLQMRSIPTSSVRWRTTASCEMLFETAE